MKSKQHRGGANGEARPPTGTGGGGGVTSLCGGMPHAEDALELPKRLPFFKRAIANAATLSEGQEPDCTGKPVRSDSATDPDSPDPHHDGMALESSAMAPLPRPGGDAVVAASCLAAYAVDPFPRPGGDAVMKASWVAAANEEKHDSTPVLS